MSDDEHGRGGHRFAFVLVGLLLVALVGGLATVGLKGPEAPTVSASSGCEAHALRFTVTDSEEEFAEQKRFEQDVNEVTPPGWFSEPVDPVPTLHAASHGSVVVFTRDDLGGEARQELWELSQRANRTKAPVTVAPRDQDAGFVAIARGYQLTCGEDTLEAATEVTRFAAQSYPSVADPAAAAAEPPPAPTEESSAPSPVDP